MTVFNAVDYLYKLYSNLYLETLKCNCHIIDESKPEVIYVTDCERNIGFVFDNNLYFDIRLNSCINMSTNLIVIHFLSFGHINGLMFMIVHKSITKSSFEYRRCICSPLFQRQSIV